MANTICQIHSTVAGGESVGVKMIHITSHTHSFKLQEAMILAEAYAESRQHVSPLKQVKVKRFQILYAHTYWLGHLCILRHANLHIYS